MNPAEKFVRFAAECQLMAKFTHAPESKTEWTQMAQRWLQYAERYDRPAVSAHRGNPAKRAPSARAQPIADPTA